MGNVQAVRRAEAERSFSAAPSPSEGKKSFILSDFKKALERQGEHFAGAKVVLLRLAVWAVNYLLPFTQRFIVKTKVTFGLTNDIGIVRHDMLANLFGNGRELFGLSRIPGFAKDAGHKYLLKTCDAVYRHATDFVFGDIIKLVVEVVEVRGASFRIRGQFIKNGQICTTAFHTIAYTNMSGMPTRLPLWLKVLLVLTCRQDYTEAGGGVGIEGEAEGRRVFRHQTIVTSDMVNAEKNVSHDVYAKMLTQMIELFLLGVSHRPCPYAFKVAEGYYKFGQDFYSADLITARLFLTGVSVQAAVFTAEFSGADGKVHTSGWQKIVFTDDRGIPKSIPQELADAIKAA